MTSMFMNRRMVIRTVAALWIGALPALASAQTAGGSYGVITQPAAAATAYSAAIAPVGCGSSDGARATTEHRLQDVAAPPACAFLSRAAAQPMSRAGRIWAGSLVGAMAGAAVGAGWGIKRTIADDDHPSGIAGYAVLGAFAGLGVGALIGAVLPNRAHATGRDPFLHVQPMVIGRERGVRATLLF